MIKECLMLLQVASNVPGASLQTDVSWYLKVDPTTKKFITTTQCNLYGTMNPEFKSFVDGKTYTYKPVPKIDVPEGMTINESEL